MVTSADMLHWQADWKEYSGVQAVLPELPAVMWKRPRVAWRDQYGSEQRRDRWTLILRLRGAMAVRWRDERLQVPGGYGILVPPGVRTGTETSALAPGTVAVVAWRDGPLPGLEVDADRAVRAAIRALPRLLPCPRDAEALVLDLLEAHRIEAGAWRTWACRSRLHRLLQALLSPAAPATPAELPPAIARALAVFRPDRAPPAVTELAAAAGLDRAVFTRRFAAALGEAPAAWMRRQRILRAQELLRGGASVTATALRLDFASSQHLADAFRRATGLSPTDWLAAIGG